MGLREQKKQATREALRTAALRLALEHGPDNVRVDDIAEAAGVSPRTYNNYFSSREQAIVAGVVGDRGARIAEQVVGAPAHVGLFDAVAEAVVGQYTEPDEATRDALLMLTTTPTLRGRYVDEAGAIRLPLADAICTRVGVDEVTAQVLAAGVGAAVQVALRVWLDVGDPPGSTGLVVPSGSLGARLREAIAVLRPAVDAATDA